MPAAPTRLLQYIAEGTSFVFLENVTVTGVIGLDNNNGVDLRIGSGSGVIVIRSIGMAGMQANSTGFVPMQIDLSTGQAFSAAAGNWTVFYELR